MIDALDGALARMFRSDAPDEQPPTSNVPSHVTPASSLPAALRAMMLALRAGAPGGSLGRHGSERSPSRLIVLGTMLGDDARAAEAALGTLAGELREAARRCARELRRDGVSPQQMLLRVKGQVRAVMVAERWTDPTATSLLLDPVVRWSIEAYYASDGGGGTGAERAD